MKKKLAPLTILVGSGKGGVGKSTIAVNLAVALASIGLEVGLLDADLYGPSLPIMLGLRRLAPRKEVLPNGKEALMPFYKFGIKSASLGFFIEESRTVLWRGPMMSGALEKLIHDIEWGSLDIFIVDLPPGTGDVPISLSKILEISGALIVTTPQEVATLDAAKAIGCFYELSIPLIGIVENMYGFKAPGSDIVYHLFGEGGAKDLAYRFDTQILASIPLHPLIGIGAEEGCPVAVKGTLKEESKIFNELAKRFLQTVSQHNLA